MKDKKVIKMKDKINKLKKEKNAIILAHYYLNDDVQDIADYIGDSYYLAKIAKESKENTIVFCGVNFMGESAKIINPNKTILMPDLSADCPMAHMVSVDYINKVKEEYKDLAVVCYINSTAKIKQHSDVCVTSSNAVDIINKLPNQNILFIPDQNLGRYCASLIKDKNFIFNDGYCPIHKEILLKDLLSTKKKYPNALVLSHPECTFDILENSDYIGSTSGILNYATTSNQQEFIIATEEGILFKLKEQNPDKKFYLITKQICPDMKKVSLNKIYDCLKNTTGEIFIDKDTEEGANKMLNKMLELAK